MKETVTPGNHGSVCGRKGLEAGLSRGLGPAGGQGRLAKGWRCNLLTLAESRDCWEENQNGPQQTPLRPVPGRGQWRSPHGPQDFVCPPGLSNHAGPQSWPPCRGLGPACDVPSAPPAGLTAAPQRAGLGQSEGLSGSASHLQRDRLDAPESHRCRSCRGSRPGFWGLCLRGDRRPCGSRSPPPTHRQAWGGALRSRCQAQRTLHRVQGSVTMATAGAGSRTPQNSEEHMGEGRTRGGAPSRPPRGGAAAPSGSPSSAPFIPVFS